MEIKMPSKEQIEEFLKKQEKEFDERIEDVAVRPVTEESLFFKIRSREDWKELVKQALKLTHGEISDDEAKQIVTTTIQSGEIIDICYQYFEELEETEIGKARHIPWSLSEAKEIAVWVKAAAMGDYKQALLAVLAIQDEMVSIEEDIALHSE